MNKKIISGLILSALIVAVLCACPNNCNGHGECNADSQCVCHKQQGLGLNDANFMLPLYTGADCSQRTCPTGVSFASFDTGSTLFSKVEAAGEGPKARLLFNDEEDRELDSNSTTTKVDLTDSVSNSTVITNDMIVPSFEQTTSKGGVMSCMVKYDGQNIEEGERMSLTVYGYQKTDKGTVFVTDLPKYYENVSISECYVTYVRRDLSLFGTIAFDNTGEGIWGGIGGLLINYGFTTINEPYNIRVACVESAKTGIIKQLDNYVTMTITENDENEKVSYDVKFNLTDNSTVPAFCFMLSTGTENGRVVNIDMITSELSMMIGRDGSNYYYGQKIQNGGVIQAVMKSTDIVGVDGNRRILEDDPTVTGPGPEFDKVSIPAGSYRYYFNFAKVYGLDGKETSTKRDYSGFVRFLSVGSKATILVQSTTGDNKLSVKQVQVTKNPVEVVCVASGAGPTEATKGLKPQSNTGCFYLYFDEKVINDATSGNSYLLNVFVSPSGVHPVIECSGNGLCNRETGQCQCYAGFDGDACQRFSCPNDCSNHGRCVQVSDALGLSINRENYPKGFGHSKDIKYSMFACICDKGHRGPDCSLLECPSQEDPINGANQKEKRDCSGRGICNYSTGNCECFQGFYGTACETLNPNQ